MSKVEIKQDLFYSSEDEWRIQRVLCNVLDSSVVSDVNDKVLPEENIIVLDDVNVLGVVAKSMRAKQILKKFINIGGNHEKIKDYISLPSLNYNALKDENIKSVYSIDYLIKIVDFWKVISKITVNETKGIKVMVRKDYPMITEDDDWKLILAPRVED